MEKQGVVTVKTWFDNTFVYALVSDTGVGIPENIISKLFDPFFTTKDIGKGTGLGLAISYGIIEKHNGTIEVFSNVGKGTTFSIKIPREMKN